VSPLAGPLVGPFAGKTAVVTGVTSGIGLALTTRLLRAGTRVFGIGRDEGGLEAAARAFGERASEFVPVLVDLASPGERQRAFADLATRTGPIDAIVNNAATCVYDTPLGLSEKETRRLWESNVHAPMDLVRALHPQLTCGGHIVNVSSVTARFLPHVRFAPYALTKAAIDRFTEALRLELAPRGIKVSSIAPGLVNTPIYEKVGGFEARLAKLHEAVPEWLEADDVAAAIEWMLGLPARVVVGELTILPLAQPR
jgi:NAD(P)-dependent dehydrogenase (short-subunit alcohol dehydrogenase family)